MGALHTPSCEKEYCLFWYQKTKQRKLKSGHTNVLFQIHLENKLLYLNAILENSNASLMCFYRNNSAFESIGKNTNEDLFHGFIKNRNLIKRDNPIFPLELLPKGIHILKIKA